MLVLSIDTATKACAVGLCRDGKILAEYKINMGMTHSEGLMPQLEQLLERTGVQKADIDLIAVSMGPGSFTGLRIGLATAEALAYAWKKPLQGVATPLALAYNLPVSGIVLSPVLDAQKGNYYQALYEWQDGEVAELQSVQVVNKQQLLENLALQGNLPLFWANVPSLKTWSCPGGAVLHPNTCACRRQRVPPLPLLKPITPKRRAASSGWSLTISENRRQKSYGNRSTGNNNPQVFCRRYYRCLQNRKQHFF